MKLREKREDTFLEARLNFDGKWQDVLIRNVSDHGVMVQCRVPPPRGSYIEIRRGRYAIVGHVRWKEGHHCGTRSQDVIDLGELSDDTHRRKPPGPDRREGQRQRHRTPLPDIQRFRETGRLLEFGFLAVAIITVAAFLALSAADVLAEPVAVVGKMLHTATH